MDEEYDLSDSGDEEYLSDEPDTKEQECASKAPSFSLKLNTEAVCNAADSGDTDGTSDKHPENANKSSVPTLGIRKNLPPALSLPSRVDRADSDPSETLFPPISARGPKPSLNLPSGQATDTKAYQVGELSNGHRTSVNIELVSSAFQAYVPSDEGESQSGNIVLESIYSRCSQGLGVTEEDLRLFELRPLNPEDTLAAISRGSHIGVQVRRSGFTLGALETLVEENTRLAANLDKCTSALEGMREEVRTQHAAAASAASALAAEETQARQWSDTTQVLEEEVSSLRTQLKRADSLRVHSQKALEDLKQEFETLTRDITGDGLLAPSTAPCPQCSQQPSEASTASSSTAPGAPAPATDPRTSIDSKARADEAANGGLSDPRAVQVLERLCSDDVLVKLQELLDKVDLVK